MGSHAIAYAVVALAIAAACLFAGFVWGRSNVKAQIEHAVEKEHVALDAREFAMRTQLEDAIAEVAKLRPLADELGRVQKRLEREQAKYAQMKAEFNSATDITPESSLADAEAELPAADESADEAIQKLLQSLEAFNDPNAPTAAEPVLSPNPAAPSSPANAKPAPAPPVAAAASVAPQPAASRPLEKPQPAVSPNPAEVARTAAPAQPAVPPQPKQPAPAPAAKTVAPAPIAPPRAPAPSPQKAAPAVPRAPAQNAPVKPAAAAAKPGQQADEWQEFARQLEALTGKKK